MRLGRYEVLGTLATGGMAEVLLARLDGSAGFERRVVIKRVLARHSGDEEFKRLFEQEARFASLLSHPNIIQVFDSGVDESGASYLVMELVDGASLRDVLGVCRERAELPDVKLVCRIFAQVAGALGAVHDAVDPTTQTPLQLVHRDVSPDNVLLSRQGAVKLSDFGISRATTEHSHTSPEHIRGKLHYLAPEQLLGLPIQPSLDVWAFGVTLFETLTLQRAFDGENEGRVMHRIATEPSPSLAAVRPDLPEALTSLVDGCLRKVPAERPSPATLAAGLELLATGVTANELGRWVTAHVPCDPQLKPFNFATTSSNPSPRKDALAQRFTAVEALELEPGSDEVLELDRSGFEVKEPPPEAPPPKPKWWLWASVAGALVIAIVGVVVARFDVRTAQTRVLITSVPTGATISVGGRELGITPWSGSMSLVAPLTIEVDAEGYEHETALLSPGVTTLEVPLHRARRQ